MCVSMNNDISSLLDLDGRVGLHTIGRVLGVRNALRGRPCSW